ncbi:MAG TPA: TatD family hydrolase [Thermoanaerobaculia bacterium]|nr:TatD family hydrolase [Thermoanaerobaculia bacterium]
MTFTDSHCHLTMVGAEGVLLRARQQGVAGFVVPATKLSDARDAISIARRHADVWCAVGFHPHEAKDCDGAAFGEISRLARDPRVVAIGETGLDYHYEHSPRETQREVFLWHLALAKETGKPVVIHNRESTDDLLDLLGSSEAKGVRVVLHSFTESHEVARELLDRGAFLSFSGIVTFRSADELREVARGIPRDRVLIETDTPYLAPVPFRGRENEPAYVVKIAEMLASLWNVPLGEVARTTTANFERAFSVTLPR